MSTIFSLSTIFFTDPLLSHSVPRGSCAYEVWCFWKVYRVPVYAFFCICILLFWLWRYFLWFTFLINRAWNVYSIIFVFINCSHTVAASLLERSFSHCRSYRYFCVTITGDRNLQYAVMSCSLTTVTAKLFRGFFYLRVYIRVYYMRLCVCVCVYVSRSTQ